MNNLETRLRRVLQRNTQGAVPAPGNESRPVAARYKDRYGKELKVITAGKIIIYRREGYDFNCQLPREKFLQDFVEIKP